MAENCAKCGEEVPKETFVWVERPVETLIFCSEECAFSHWLATRDEDSPEETQTEEDEKRECRACGRPTDDGADYCPIHQRQLREWKRS